MISIDAIAARIGKAMVPKTWVRCCNTIPPSGNNGSHTIANRSPLSNCLGRTADGLFSNRGLDQPRGNDIIYNRTDLTMYRGICRTLLIVDYKLLKILRKLVHFEYFIKLKCRKFFVASSSLVK